MGDLSWPFRHHTKQNKLQEQFIKYLFLSKQSGENFYCVAICYAQSSSIFSLQYFMVNADMLQEIDWQNDWRAQSNLILEKKLIDFSLPLKIRVWRPNRERTSVSTWFNTNTAFCAVTQMLLSAAGLQVSFSSLRVQNLSDFFFPFSIPKTLHYLFQPTVQFPDFKSLSVVNTFLLTKRQEKNNKYKRTFS